MNEEPEDSTITFHLQFGPEVTVPVSEVVGDDVVMGASIPLGLNISLADQVITTDELDALVGTVTLEVNKAIDDLVLYLTTPGYRGILRDHLLQAVATYRGTVLRKGIPSRETRRTNGERYMRLLK